MERRNVVLPITERTFSGTRVLAVRALARRALRNNEGLNVVEEVGRDPLRVPAVTPPDEIIDFARSLAEARKRLETVLPQATKADNLSHLSDPEV